MESDMRNPVEVAQLEMQQKLGGCMLRLQQYERMWKAMVSPMSLEGHPVDLRAVRSRQETASSKKTLGTLVGLLATQLKPLQAVVKMWPLGQSGRLLWLQEVHCTTPAAATADAIKSEILQVGNGELLCNWLASSHNASFRQAHARRCRRTNPLANQQRRRNGRHRVGSSGLDGLAYAASLSRELKRMPLGARPPIEESPQPAAPIRAARSSWSQLSSGSCSRSVNACSITKIILLRVYELQCQDAVSRLQ